jgi:hypothetical protein
MNKKVISRTAKVLSECKIKGKYLYFKYNVDPIFFCSIWNERGDLASISENSAIIEPIGYAPKWSAYVSQWAKQEGFCDKTVKNQDLSREVKLNEVIEFFSHGD